MYRGVICFACIKIASTLASSLACAFFALCLFVAFRLSFGFAFPLSACCLRLSPPAVSFRFCLRRLLSLLSCFTPFFAPSFVSALVFVLLGVLCMRLFPRPVRSMQSAETSEPAEMEERRQGERPAGLVLLCLIAFAIGAYYIIMRGLCLRGATPQPPGGTFSVRVGKGKEPNRSCSSSQPIVRKAIHSLPR